MSGARRTLTPALSQRERESATHHFRFAGLGHVRDSPFVLLGQRLDVLLHLLVLVFRQLTKRYEGTVADMAAAREAEVMGG